MNNNPALTGSILYALPAVTAAICLALLFTNLLSSARQQVHRKLVNTTIAAYFLQFFSWVCMVIYVLSPALFVVIQAFFYFAFVVWNVFMYRIIFLLTGTGKKEHFSIIHYILPAIIPALLFVWSLFVPMDAQVFIVESRGAPAPGYEAYSWLFTSKPGVLFIWNITYAMLSLGRIVRYRRAVSDYSADEGRTPVRWMINLFWLKILQLAFPLIALTLGREVLVGSVGMAVPVVLITLQQILLCYNIVAENYVLIPENVEAAGIPEKGRRLDHERLEHYIHIKKPYLNPKLRITDMASDLHTNRTYLSGFINKEYGMNFNRWVNRLRLEELDRIRLDPAHSRLTGMELVMQAGFTNYRAYMRVKKEEDRLTFIKDS